MFIYYISVGKKLFLCQVVVFDRYSAGKWGYRGLPPKNFLRQHPLEHWFSNCDPGSPGGLQSVVGGPQEAAEKLLKLATFIAL